jgi:hypothetical protein
MSTLQQQQQPVGNILILDHLNINHEQGTCVLETTVRVLKEKRKHCWYSVPQLAPSH